MSMEKIALSFQENNSVYVIIHGEKYYAVSRHKYLLKIRSVEADRLFSIKSKEEIGKIVVYVNEQELLIRILPFNVTHHVNLGWIDKHPYQIPI